MKELNGTELVGYIQERQAKQVRNLRQAHKVVPRLAIVVANDSPVIETYMRLKKRYGEEILIEVDICRETMDTIEERLAALNQNPAVHGIIVQLPLADQTRTDDIVKLIAEDKDVDGLASSHFDAATALAINWLMAGYGVELRNKHILIVGNGRLVGRPLSVMWANSGYDVKVVDDTVEDLKAECLEADIIVTATGVPGLITSEMIRPEAVIVDAGTASENGQIVGDVATDVRDRHDLTITPVRGGVGPLTVAALFDNVIRATRESISD